MLRTLVLGGLLVGSMLSGNLAMGGETSLPPAREWVPKDAVAVVELDHLQPLLHRLLAPKTLDLIASQPAYQKAAARPDFQRFTAIVHILSGAIGMDWKEAAHMLLDGGATLAVGPGSDAVLLIDAQDAGKLQQLHELVLNGMRDEAKKQHRAAPTSKEVDGVSVWSGADKHVHALVGRRLLLANREETLRRVLALRQGTPAASIASLPDYRAARQALKSDSLGLAWVNLAVVKKLPALQRALIGEGQPMAVLLGGNLRDSLREGRSLTMTLDLAGDNLTWKAVVDAAPTPAVAFARPTGDDGALPNLQVPRAIAAVSLYRDLHAFYAAKDQLFPNRTSGLIFFENMMGIFFSGRDLTEEVFAEPRPPVRVVVAAQDYDPAVGTPELRVPGMAAVFKVAHPKEFGEVMEEAWQKALGLINFTRGQKAEPGMILDRGTYGDVRYSVAYFSVGKRDDRAKLNARFNFRPTLARVDDYVVLSSTEQLARDVIDALRRQAADRPLPGATELAQFEAPQLATLLQANREHLVQQNMVAKGHSHDEAEYEVNLFLQLLERLGKARLQLGVHDGKTIATLQAKFNWE